MNMNFFQALEQTQAILRDFASPMSTYYKRLVEEGVPEESAAKMAAEMQHVLFRGE